MLSNLCEFAHSIVPPEFEPQMEALSSKTLDEGQELMLSCRIRRRANPGSRIYWEKDGRALVNYGNVSINSDTSTLPSSLERDKC